MALVNDVLNALRTAGLVDGSSGWKGYYGYMQEAPDMAICIYETGGDPPEENWKIDRPSFQIKVRSVKDDYDGCRAKLLAIYNLLHGGEAQISAGAEVSPKTGGSYVYCYAVQSGPIPLGQDQNRRPMMAQNYRAMYERP